MVKNKAIYTLVLCLIVSVYVQASVPGYDRHGDLEISAADLNGDQYNDILDLVLAAGAWTDDTCGLSNSVQPCRYCAICA